MFDHRENDVDEDDPEFERHEVAAEELALEEEEEEYADELDWTTDFDDFDSELWEVYCGGPEDDDRYDDFDSELWEDSFGEPEYDDFYDAYESASGFADPMPPRPVDPRTLEEARRARIVEWLRRSVFARPLAGRPRNGFLVEGGRLGTLRSGEQVEIVAWLKREGLTLRHLVGGYEATYHPPSGGRPAWIKFMVSDTCRT